MNVNEYLNHVGLDRQFWADPSLRFLVELLLNVYEPAPGPAERFLAGTVHMDDPDNEGTRTSVVHEIAVELLEAAISGHITTLMSFTRPVYTNVFANDLPARSLSLDSEALSSSDAGR